MDATTSVNEIEKNSQKRRRLVWLIIFTALWFLARIGFEILHQPQVDYNLNPSLKSLISVVCDLVLNVSFWAALGTGILVVLPRLSSQVISTTKLPYSPEIIADEKEVFNQWLESDGDKKIPHQFAVAMHRFSAMIFRLRESQQKSEFRGRLNLILGGLAAASGASMLLYSFQIEDFLKLADKIDPKESASILQETLIAFLASKVSITLIVELVAFFFLRLYSKSLEETKYYANEIMILETKFMGYLMATVHDHPENRAKIAELFATFERNIPPARSQRGLDKNTADLISKIMGQALTIGKPSGE